MTTRKIEAEAVISAADKTGNTFDAIAKKMRGVAAAGKEIEKIKPPRFVGNLEQELKRLKLSEKEMNDVRVRRQKMLDTVWGSKADANLRARQDWMDKEVQHWRKVKAGIDETAMAHKRLKTVIGAGAGVIGAGTAAYYGGRAVRYAFDRSKEANRETTKQTQAGLSDRERAAIQAEAERQSRNYPTLSQTELRSAGREAALQMGNSEAGLKMMPTIAKFMTSGKVLWGEDKIEEQTRKALQILDARQITDPKRAETLLNDMVKASQVEGGADYTAGDLRTAIRQGRDMVRGQSDRFVTSVLPQLGVDMGFAQAGTGLRSMNSALIGGRQKDEATEFQKKVGLRNDKGLVGARLFQTDVDKWFDQHYIPTLQKQKIDIDDQAAVAAFNAKFFSNATAGDVAGNMVSGRNQRVKRTEQQEKAKGMEGAETLHTRDVGAAMEGVSSQLANVASNAKLAEAALSGLNGAMGLIQKMGEEINKPGGWYDRGKKQIESEVRDAKAIGGVVGSVLDWDKRTSAAGRAWLDGGPGSTRLGTRKPGMPPSWPTSAQGVPFVDGAPSMKYVPAEGYRTPGAVRLGGGRRVAPPSFASPGISETMQYGTGTSGIGGTVQATLTGSADVHGEATLTVKIEAPELIRAYHDAQKAIALAGRLNSNGPGSTGRSSPDAQAPSGKGFGGGGM